MAIDAEEIISKLKNNKLFIPAVAIGAVLGVVVLVRNSGSGSSQTLTTSGDIPTSINPDEVSSPEDSFLGSIQSQIDQLSSSFTTQLSGVQTQQEDFFNQVTDYVNELDYPETTPTTVDYSFIDGLQSQLNSLVDSVAGQQFDVPSYFVEPVQFTASPQTYENPITFPSDLIRPTLTKTVTPTRPVIRPSLTKTVTTPRPVIRPSLTKTVTPVKPNPSRYVRPNLPMVKQQVKPPVKSVTRKTVITKKPPTKSVGRK